MYKFRTMVSNADALVEELEDKNEKSANGQLFKMKNDPRITRVGRFLRKWSLDELPQIINVYKGEMSLVGPRPPLPREVENYSSEHYCRLKGLPGITGLWQVSGRSDLSFERDGQAGQVLPGQLVLAPGPQHPPEDLRRGALPQRRLLVVELVLEQAVGGR